MGPTQPMSIWCQGLFPKGQSGPSVRLTALLHLVSKLRMHFAIPSPPYALTLTCDTFTLHLYTLDDSLANTATFYCFRLSQPLHKADITTGECRFVAYCVCRLIYFGTFIAYILCIMNRQLGPWQVLTAERAQSDTAGRLFLEYSPCSQPQFLRRHVTYT